MKKLKIKLLNFLLRKYFNAITEEDILTVTSRGYRIGDRLLDSNEIEGLRNQADIVKRSDLWKYTNSNLKYLANYRMYDGSQNQDDLIFGKAMLYNLDIINRLFNKISGR
jgi:outer membrane receptor protein involved in Fe transport